MAVTGLTVRRMGVTGWRLGWDSGAGTVYVWQDGVLVGTTSARHWDVTVPGGWYPVFVVTDDATELPQGYPGQVVVQWYRVVGAGHYLVHELVSGSWVRRARVRERGQGYYRWTSGWLEDGASHRFRVTAYGEDGNAGTAAGLAVLMVRHPDPPDVGLSYSSVTGKVTVAAS